MGASTLGAMFGLGGGFIVVPILRLFFGLPPALAAGDSLALIVATSASSSYSYLLQRRVDLRVGLLIAAGSVPGSILGVFAVKNASSAIFDWLFAAFLLVAAADIALRHDRARPAASSDQKEVHRPWSLLIGAGFIIGLISSLFGVGGGLVLVPALLYMTDLTAHAVSATSQFGILLTAPVGLAAHAVQQDVQWRYALPLVVGGLLGGPLGAKLAGSVRSRALLRLIAIAMAFAALALAARHIVAVR